MMKRAVESRRNQSGQTLVEYALILAFISIVAISVLMGLHRQIQSAFTGIDSRLSSAQTSH